MSSTNHLIGYGPGSRFEYKADLWYAFVLFSLPTIHFWGQSSRSPQGICLQSSWIYRPPFNLHPAANLKTLSAFHGILPYTSLARKAETQSSKAELKLRNG